MSEERKEDIKRSLVHDRLYTAFQGAYDATGKHVSMTPALAENFKSIDFFATQVLKECFPFDLESLKRICYFPIIEAGLELEYSLFFAKAGVYKVAYMCLRNFLELSLVCFHYLLVAKAKGNTWVKGQSPTPFKKDILSVLFDNPDFQHFDRAIHLKDRINCQYGELSDICHTKGQPCSHRTLSQANFPNMVEESLNRYVDRSKDIIDLVIICFVSVNPIILFSLPIDEKFGMNGPMSGFLQEYQVKVLRQLLKPESLKHLLEHYEFDPGVVSIRQSFEEMQDITEEEFKRQLEDFDKFMKEMAPKNISSRDPIDK